MAGIKEADYIWMDGEFVPWKEAKVHVLTHALHYGTGVFEGTRAYETKKGPAVFRLKDHVKRLFNSARIYRMEIPYTQEEIIKATKELIKKNGLKSCYIRHLVYRGYHSLGVNPFPCPVKVAIAAWEWGAYLGEEALEKGVDVMVSTWHRAAPNTFPAMAKATANYANGALMKMEALEYGYEEAISLSFLGFVSEGSGENLFLVKDGKIYTPDIGSSILLGITRHSVIKLAEDLGYKVRETIIPREFLYIVDEAFFTGTAAEITPIRSIDKIVIGEGKRGPITKRLQEEFFKIVRGENEKYYNWLDFVE